MSLSSTKLLEVELEEDEVETDVATSLFRLFGAGVLIILGSTIRVWVVLEFLLRTLSKFCTNEGMPFA